MKKNKFGELIKFKRLGLGLSIRELATFIGLKPTSYTSIKAWEGGVMPNARVFIRLIDALGIRLDEARDALGKK